MSPARMYTEVDAVAYAARHGVRLATARSALNVAPPAAAATAGLTCIEIRCKARNYAAEHGISRGEALKALGLEEAYAAAQLTASGAASLSQHQQTLLAKAHAAKYGLGFLAAHKALGFSEPTPDTVAESAVELFKRANGLE